MSAWTKGWYETEGVPDIWDRISDLCSQVPGQTEAFRLQRKAILKKWEFYPRPEPFLGAPKLVPLWFQRPSFGRVCRALEKIHGGTCACDQNTSEFCAAEFETDLESMLDFMDDTSWTSEIVTMVTTIKKTKSFQSHKRTEVEESQSLDKLRLLSYDRDFDDEWNDIVNIR